MHTSPRSCPRPGRRQQRLSRRWRRSRDAASRARRSSSRSPRARTVRMGNRNRPAAQQDVSGRRTPRSRAADASDGKETPRLRLWKPAPRGARVADGTGALHRGEAAVARDAMIAWGDAESDDPEVVTLRRGLRRSGTRRRPCKMAVQRPSRSRAACLEVGGRCKHRRLRLSALDPLITACPVELTI